MTPPTTVAEIVARNRAAGRHFFSAATMRFFGTRVRSRIFPLADGGAFFVTSERASFLDATRVYSLRYIAPGGEVSTVGAFGEHPTARSAFAAAERMMAARRVSVAGRA